MKRWLMILTLGVAWCRAVAGADLPGAAEYQVKAACLLNFAKFVEWPPGTFSATNAPLTIGVLGEDPFGDDLNQVVKGQSVSGHAIVVKRFKELQAFDMTP